jgi:hypothetical protein
MPALIANGKGQAPRVTLHLSDNTFQFFAGSAYRTLLKAPFRVELCDASGAGFCAASENLKLLGDTFFLQILNFPSCLRNGPVF